MSEIEVLVEADVPDEGADYLEAVAPALWSVARLLFEHRRLDVPNVRLIVTDDIMAVADRENRRLGLDPDRRSGVERVGGIVAGKTMCNDAGSDAVVLVIGDLVRSGESIARHACATTTAHEFGHLVYGAARIASIGVTCNVSLPWDVAGMIGLLAAEEYRVDLLGQLFVEHVLSASDDEGNAVELKSLEGNPLDWLVGSLDHISPGMRDTVNAYRMHRMPLGELFVQIARVSDEVTLCCAHAESHHREEVPLLDALSSHPALAVLELVWTPVSTHLRRSSLLPEPEEWGADREQIVTVSRDGWMAAWELLGLRPTPNGDGYYLAVSEPLL